LENFNDNDIVSVIRHCGHVFQNDALNRWFASNSRCPVCRYDVRTFEPRLPSYNSQEGVSGRYPERNHDDQPNSGTSNNQTAGGILLETILESFTTENLTLNDLLYDLSGNGSLTNVGTGSSLLNLLNTFPRGSL
jgi:hypothetical protein